MSLDVPVVPATFASSLSWPGPTWSWASCCISGYPPSRPPSRRREVRPSSTLPMTSPTPASLAATRPRPKPPLCPPPPAKRDLWDLAYTSDLSQAQLRPRTKEHLNQHAQLKSASFHLQARHRAVTGNVACA